ncbi:MAG: hypothetical protein NT129_01945 [Candidatus Aenigmarchaeota archaeon]|nr:hypothetical protein [Candidatus Aenigmarchaeota archaeon]
MLAHLEEMFRLVRQFLLNKGRTKLESHGLNPKGDVSKGFDLAAEEIVINYCRNKRLPVELVTEERGIVKISDSPEYTLVLDPVDGSINFAKGIEAVGFSIAVLPYGELLLDNVKFGLIGNVFSGTVFKAEKGKGAFRNNERIKTSRIENLSKAFLFTASEASKIRDMLNIIKKVDRVRCLGSASLELSFIANGSAEVLIIMGLTPENFAAAYLIIKEAGGILTDVRGNELPALDMKKGYDILAAGNKKMHEQIIELLR